MENHHFWWENPLYMAIFDSYVSHYQRLWILQLRTRFIPQGILSSCTHFTSGCAMSSAFPVTACTMQVKATVFKYRMQIYKDRNQNEWIGNSKESEWTWNSKKLARLAKATRLFLSPESDFPSLIDRHFSCLEVSITYGTRHSQCHRLLPGPPAPAFTGHRRCHRQGKTRPGPAPCPQSPCPVPVGVESLASSPDHFDQWIQPP